MIQFHNYIVYRQTGKPKFSSHFIILTFVKCKQWQTFIGFHKRKITLHSTYKDWAENKLKHVFAYFFQSFYVPFFICLKLKSSYLFDWFGILH